MSVYQTKNGKWRAQIYDGGKMKHVGLFYTELAAKRAYNKAIRLRDGEQVQIKNAEGPTWQEDREDYLAGGTATIPEKPKAADNDEVVRNRPWWWPF